MNYENKAWLGFWVIFFSSFLRQKSDKKTTFLRVKKIKKAKKKLYIYVYIYIKKKLYIYIHIYIKNKNVREKKMH